MFYIRECRESCRLVCYSSIYKYESSLKLNRQTAWKFPGTAAWQSPHAAIINISEEGCSSPTGFMKWRFTSANRGPEAESRQGKLPSLPLVCDDHRQDQPFNEDNWRSRGSIVEFWAAGWSHQKFLLVSASKKYRLCPRTESGKCPLFSKGLKQHVTLSLCFK